MPSRRAMLLSPLAVMAAGDVLAASGKMTLAIHQNTSSGAGYRKSLEGWSRAGIKHVEITAALLDDFLKTDYAPCRTPGPHRPGTDAGLVRVRRRRSLGAESESRGVARESEEAL